METQQKESTSQQKAQDHQEDTLCVLIKKLSDQITDLNRTSSFGRQIKCFFLEIADAALNLVKCFFVVAFSMLLLAVASTFAFFFVAACLFGVMRLWGGSFSGASAGTWFLVLPIGG